MPVAGCPFASPKIDLLCQQAFASGSFSLFSPPPRFRCENPVDSHNALSFGFFVQKILSIRGYGSLAKWLIPALDAPSITALLRGLHFHPPHISSCKWIGFDFLKYLPFCHWKKIFWGGKIFELFFRQMKAAGTGALIDWRTFNTIDTRICWRRRRSSREWQLLLTHSRPAKKRREKSYQVVGETKTDEPTGQWEQIISEMECGHACVTGPWDNTQKTQI